MRRCGGAAIACAVAVLAPLRASSDPLVLRADALATTAAPAGLVILSADGDAGAGLSAEAVVWTGDTSRAAGDRADGDVLVIALHARTRDGRAMATLGRFVAMLGALRPVHIDGASARVRLPYRFVAEAYAGLPVAPDSLVARTWDWAIGSRVSRAIGDWGSAGVAYREQRDDGRLDAEELGLDAGAALGRHDDVAGKLSYDLANPGLAEATVTASDRRGAWRSELYATYLAASHLLPATSLFSVLGDTPALRLGATATWRAAPRLDVVADLAVRRSDGDAIDAAPASRFATAAAAAGDSGEVNAPAIAVRATLKLDDRGASALGGELRRDGTGDAGWTGARASVRIALPCALVATGELEVVAPDRDRGWGRLWPWGLAALGWTGGAWHAAIAVEAQASPEDRRRLDVLARVSRMWSLR